jgi:hypothetical protein
MAVNVTESPTTEGFSEELNVVIVLIALAGLMISANAADALGPCKLSP